MKVSRPLLIGLAAPVLLLILALVAAFTPAVQRWAVLRAARSQPGTELAIDRLAAGPGRFEVAGLRLKQGGVVLTADRVEGEYRLWPLLTGTRLEIGRLTGRGIVVDAARVPAGDARLATAAPAAAPGALGTVELPMELVLGTCDLEGRALLPGGAGRPPIEAGFNVTGGGITPGREGTLRLLATIRNPAPGARVATLKAEAAVRLTQSRARTFSRVAVASTIDAEGPGLNGATQLRIDGTYDHGAAGESYGVRVDSVAGGLSDTLVAVDAKLPVGAVAYEGTWRIRASRAQVEPFYLGGELPDFEARGEGQVRVALATRSGALQGSLDVDARRFERLDPALRAVGAVRLQTRFDLAKEDGVARLRQLEVALAGEQPVLELRSTQALAFDAASRRIQIAGDGAGEVARVRLLGLPLVWVRPFVTGFELSGGRITGEIALTSDGRAVSAQTVTPLQLDEINVVRDGEVLLSKARLSAELEAALAEGRWRSQVRRLEFATAAGDSLSAQLAAEGAIAPESPISVSGEYQARLPTLLQPYLESFQAHAEGEIALTLGSEVSVDKLTSRVQTLDGQPVLSTEVRQPFKYSTQRGTIVAGADAELMRVDLGRIALGPLLGRVVGGIGGMVTQGSFALESDGGGWRLRPVQPVVVQGFELAEAGRPALGGVTVQAAPRVTMSADARLVVDVGDTAVRTAAGAPLASLKGEIARDATGTRANGTFQLELPALGQLPAFATAEPLSQGRAAGEVRAVLDEKGEQVEARLTINGLVARDSGALLPVANISLRALRRPNDEMSVEVPVLLDRAGVRSDMQFTATLARGGAGHLLKAKLGGNEVALEDLVAVMAVFSAASGASPASGAVAAPAIGAPVAPDAAPPWSRIAGEVGLEFRRLTYGKDWTATDLRGSLQIEPTRVSLPIAEAAFGERGRLEAHGELTFTKGERPYAFGGSFSVSEFDPGPFFKALDPERPPTVEGLFNVEGKFAGDGRTLDETLEQTRGEFQLTSRQGVFRGLKRGTEKVSMATRAVGALGSIGSLLGTDKMKGTAEKVAGGAYVADQVAQELAELKYDQLALRIERGESLDVKLTEIALISPEVRLVGQGGIRHMPGRSLLDQPLSVELTLAARGKLENLLDRVNALNGPTSRDDLGYQRAKLPFVLEGSVAKPDTTSFYTRYFASRLLESLLPDN
ncbi:MAG TPA: AsmA-like C-terminal region-containing protein [Opitutaceae bacterium]|nr:AsmA-like C-terminal region-containing protein [Opitutaceae bacterium]